MPWRYSAKKGNWRVKGKWNIRDNGASPKKSLIKKRAATLRKAGWDVRIYKVKGDK